MPIGFLGPTHVTDRTHQTDSVDPLGWVPLDCRGCEVKFILPLGCVSVPGDQDLALFQIDLQDPDLPDAKFSGHGVPHAMPMAVVDDVPDFQAGERNRHLSVVLQQFLVDQVRDLAYHIPIRVTDTYLG